MNKFGISLAVLALINNASGIRIRDDNLFNDDDEQASTLASIQAAEKIHGSKFTGISAEDQRDIVHEKSNMQFDSNDEFIKNDKRIYNKVLLQVEDELNQYPIARPIGEALAQIGKNEDFGKVLSGPSLNDEDDANDTLESLAEAEKAYHKQMKTPTVSNKLYQKTGSKIENLLGEDSKIYTKMLNLDGELDKETRAPHRVDQDNKLKKLSDMDAKKKEFNKDQESMAIHFMDQGFTEDDMM